VLAGRSERWSTLHAQTLRAAIVELTGQPPGPYAGAHRRNHELTMDDLLWRAGPVIEQEFDSVRNELRRHSIDVLVGSPSFVDPHTLEVNGRRVAAERFVIAVGRNSARPPNVELDGQWILDADGLLGLSAIPETLAVVGAGVIGLEYASMAANLGIDVTVVERRQRLLDFVDGGIVETLSYHLRGLGVDLRLGEDVEAARAEGGRAVLRLRSGEELAFDVALYAVEPHGATDSLDLQAAGVDADARGLIAVTADFRTSAAHIFAAGEVVSSHDSVRRPTDQGRLAALAAFGEQAVSSAHLLPYGIYTIPEIAFVGPTGDELARQQVPYVAGTARYSQVARGEIAGDRVGLLKLLVHAETRHLLGVHIIGTWATDLVHVGQAVIAGELPVDYLAETAFNAPTFTEVYRLAALDARNRLEAVGSLPLPPSC
jgi:NAD(P) transhydrogenase